MQKKRNRIQHFPARLVARITDKEHKKITDFAKENNTTISNLIRDFITKLK